MLADLIPYLNSLNWTDETILRAVKDYEWSNITLEQFDQLVTAHERRFKLAALSEKEENE